MQIIKLSATESTNAYLKEMIEGEYPADLTVVVTDKQTKGKGQMNAVWESYPFKNLTFSVLKRHSKLEARQQFIITMCVSLAVVAVFDTLKLPKIRIKWPNDILSGTTKICGILIENNINGTFVKTSVIGIGINVNQTTFSKGLNATSIKKLLGKDIDLDSLLKSILIHLENYLEKISLTNFENILVDYEGKLFKKNVAATFEEPNGRLFTGVIEGVSKIGKLKVRIDDTTIKEYNLKEVRMRY
ncbi:biotin--[acetyl-CoA-carboxylase] ligase [Maribacter sp. CXY002]|uniref:biotin--[acetyl-CoA-carboxylase] ligase n=1 Tax=Maribacter luteocoastalis TaxID=3407671 RepID=UPI003B6817AD